MEQLLILTQLLQENYNWKKNHIFSHAAIGTIPQDLKFNGEDVEPNY